MDTGEIDAAVGRGARVRAGQRLADQVLSPADIRDVTDTFWEGLVHSLAKYGIYNRVASYSTAGATVRVKVRTHRRALEIDEPLRAPGSALHVFD
jgi:hypothetical protein